MTRQRDRSGDMACPLCDYSATETPIPGQLAVRVSCRTCGVFTVTDSLTFTLPTVSLDDRARLSAATRIATLADKQLSLSEENLHDVMANTGPRNPAEKADLLLRYLARCSERPGALVPLDETRDYPVAYAADADEFGFLLRSLSEKQLAVCREKGHGPATVIGTDGRIREMDEGAPAQYEVTLSGYEYLAARQRAFRGATGWERVDRSLKDAEERLAQARTEEQLQSVGLLCRETLISLAQAVYDPKRHPTADGKNSSSTDGVRMLDAFVATELKGSGSTESRAVVKKADALADALQHKRNADYRMASLCLEATRSIVEMIAILAGKRDRP